MKAEETETITNEAVQTSPTVTGLCLPPAEGVAVLEGGAVDQPALLLQPPDDVLICILKTHIFLGLHIYTHFTQ